MLITDWEWYAPEDDRVHVAMAITLAPGVTVPPGKRFKEFARALMDETGWQIATSIGASEIDGKTIITVVKASVKEDDRWRTPMDRAST